MPDTGPARVVIAAEEPMVARILEHKLRREGHDVTWVRDAASLAAALRAQPVDVGILDPGLVSAPVDVTCGWLALVERRDADGARNAMGAGAAGLVSMPFKPTDVAAQVETLLSVVRA